jgi:hypothetical protein
MPGTEPLVIDPRFNGPPDSANGGVACGAVAGLLVGPAEVSLRAPVPLGVPLDVERRDGGVVVSHEGTVVAEGHPAGPVDVEPPLLSTVAEAREAQRAHPWLGRSHPFDGCWVCAPGRHDGLGMVWGPHPRDPRCNATLLIADATVPHEGERVTPQVMWAALDCPSYAPELWDLERPSMLARLHGELIGTVTLGQPVVALGWSLASDGRKQHTASALLDATGRVLARARALWIRPR